MVLATAFVVRTLTERHAYETACTDSVGNLELAFCACNLAHIAHLPEYMYIDTDSYLRHFGALLKTQGTSALTGVDFKANCSVGT